MTPHSPMTLTALFIAFFMACSVTTALNTVSTAFDKSVGPCTDLFGHVCVDTKEVHEFLTRANYGLVANIAAILKEQGGDPVLNAITEALYKEHNKTESQKKQCRLEGYGVTEADIKSQSEYKLGTVYAEMLVHGRYGAWKSPLQVYCTEENRKVCELYWHESKEMMENKLGEVKNQFVKGVVDRFVELGGFSFGADDYVKYPDVTSSDLVPFMMAETDWEKRSDIIHSLTYRKNFESFAAYSNVLFAHTLYTNKDWLNPDVAEEFERLTVKIKEEIIQNFQDSDWLTEDDKKSLIDHMHSLKVNIGVPEKYRNVTLLEEMLKRYRTAFANATLDGECDLEMLTRTHGLVRHQMIYNGIGTVYTLSFGQQADRSIFSTNAAQSGNNIILNPANLHVLNDYTLSTGFKYGFLATVIGHEIFHAFWFQWDDSRPQQQQKCYADFYGNKKFCLPGRQDEEGCPVGENKANEGYCDVESARVVFHLLKKALGASRKKRSPEDADYLPLFRWRPPGVPEEEALLFDNIEDELKQFFYGLQIVDCTPNASDEQIRIQLKDWHPRDQIRMNAVAQQMPEFSDLFQCKAGDKNYRVPPEEMCALYPRRKNPVSPPVGTENPTSTPEARTENPVQLEVQINTSNGKPKSRDLVVLLLAVFMVSI
uniref:Peptidase_M13 domain-containing protein n=1 Tax=Steinernema glaseri TaxID=37863 RepID=A0A1I7XVM2_9BILA